MDDEHTKQALDDLADLFLTGVRSDAAAGGQAAARQPRRGSDPLDAPAPIRLKPKPAVAAAGAGEPEHQPAPPAAPYLRLTEDEQEPDAAPSVESASSQARPAASAHRPPDTPAPSVAVRVEAVLLGNLPGVSGPWLTQYAQVLADQDGPVVLLHVGGERIDMELVEPGDAVGGLRPVIDMNGSNDPRPAVVALLDSLVRAADHPVATVLIHVEPAVDGTEALRLFAIDDWTLLCGADDASVVGAYRMLKQRAEVDVTVSDKRIGLMVMGADGPQSRAAARRIADTADSFLHTPVELVGWQKQMIPVHVRQLGTFEGVSRLWPKLCDWFATLEPPALEHVEAPAPAEQDATSPVPPPQTRRAKAETRKPQAEAPRRPRPQATPAPQPAPTVEKPPPIPHPPPDIAAPSFASLIETLPGGILLEARCPHLPAAEIVLDQQGRLHLLHKQTGDVQQAITELLTARQWVQEHCRLLALTQRQLRLDQATAPLLHLLTERSEQATQLVARLGDQVKLHLLRRVSVGEQSAWVCAPLN